VPERERYLACVRKREREKEREREREREKYLYAYVYILVLRLAVLCRWGRVSGGACNPVSADMIKDL